MCALQLDHEITSSWWQVTTPLWIYFGLMALTVCFDCTRAKLVRATLDAGVDVESGMQANVEVGGKVMVVGGRHHVTWINSW